MIIMLIRIAAICIMVSTPLIVMTLFAVLMDIWVEHLGEKDKRSGK